MTLRISRELDAKAIAAALEKLYPSYRYTAVKYSRHRLWNIQVHCQATNALIQTRAEV